MIRIESVTTSQNAIDIVVRKVQMAARATDSYAKMVKKIMETI